MNILETVLRIAATQVGQMEEPPGSNRGRMVDAYQRAIGLDPAGANAWCMAYVFWCFAEAAKELHVQNPAIKSAQCLDVWRRASQLSAPKQLTSTQAKTNWKAVKPGMIFILEINASTGAGHTGIVESVSYQSGILTTLEGNSNENGSREGLGVFRLKRRRINSINVGFIDYSETVPLVGSAPLIASVAHK